jgi:hypothetical protein
MAQRRVVVAMRVGLAGGIVAAVVVPMMGVMNVGMRVIERIMDVHVSVALGQMKPDTNRHQRTGQDKSGGQRRAKRQRDQRANERRSRKIRAGPARPKFA